MDYCHLDDDLLWWFNSYWSDLHPLWSHARRMIAVPKERLNREIAFRAISYKFSKNRYPQHSEISI